MGGVSFAPIPGTDGKYIADSEGNIYGPRGPRKPHIQPNNRGVPYWALMLHHADHSSRRMSWHRAVYSAFQGEIPEGLVIRHLDGNSVNNRLVNLAAGTHAENMADAKIHGTLSSGETHYASKISDADVVEIRRAYRDCQVLQRDIARAYGLTQSHVSNLTTGKSRKGAQ